MGEGKREDAQKRVNQREACGSIWYSLVESSLEGFHLASLFRCCGRASNMYIYCTCRSRVECTTKQDQWVTDRAECQMNDSDIMRIIAICLDVTIHNHDNRFSNRSKISSLLAM